MGAFAGPDISESGLVLALDAGNPKKSYKTDNNLLDLSTWYVGATSVSGFSFNGAAGENALISDTDPFGNTAVIWKAYNPDGNADGGWKTSPVSIDHTKTYRFSVWVNRKVTGTDGRFYFGLEGLNSSQGDDGVLFRVNGNNDTNPYFVFTGEGTSSASTVPEDEWVLVVGHVWPSGSGTGSNKDDSGVWKTDGTKLTGTATFYDYVWKTTTVYTQHRTYLFYSEGDASVIQHWAYPRVDLIDGTEPSIDDLINNRVNSLYWYDISGNGNNGTLVNGVGYNSGNLGSLSFDGSNDYVSLTSTDLRFGGSNSYTFDFFIKVPHSTSNQTIFSNGNLSTPGNGIWFFKRRSGLDNKLTFHGYSTNPRIDLLSTNIIPDNDFCSVSLTFNGVDTYSVYINGQLENSITTNPIVAATGNSFIGATNGTGSFFGGNIYSAKIYNRALTASEIQQNFNATRGRYGI